MIETNHKLKWLLESCKGQLKAKDKGTFFHSIAACEADSCNLYDTLLRELKKGEGQDAFLNQLLEHKDGDGNTVLHKAAKHDPVTHDKLEMITKLLQQGALPAKTNNEGKTFLKMSIGVGPRLCDYISSKMPDHWFSALAENKELLRSFIDMDDDDIFCEILKKFSKLSEQTADTEKDRAPGEKNHPMEFLDYLWDKRDVLPKSFDQLLTWEIRFHGNDLDKLHQCCFETLKPDRSFIIFDSLDKRYFSTY